MSVGCDECTAWLCLGVWAHLSAPCPAGGCRAAWPPAGWRPHGTGSSPSAPRTPAAAAQLHSRKAISASCQTAHLPHGLPAAPPADLLCICRVAEGGPSVSANRLLCGSAQKLEVPGTLSKKLTSITGFIMCVPARRGVRQEMAGRRSCQGQTFGTGRRLRGPRRGVHGDLLVSRRALHDAAVPQRSTGCL